MRNTYSLYDAKAKLSAIIRMVREGRSAIITLHGKPVAEIRPVAEGRSATETRLSELEVRGVIVRPASDGHVIPEVARRPGALKRFLAERE